MRPAGRTPRVHGVECDRCGTRRLVSSSESIADLRAKLRRLGWLCTKSDGQEMDVCERCRL